MMQHPLLPRLEPIFRHVLNSPSLVLTEDTRMGKCPEWDSFAQIDLMLAIEEEFGVEFESEEIDKLRAVRQILAALDAHIGSVQG